MNNPPWASAHLIKCFRIVQNTKKQENTVEVLQISQLYGAKNWPDFDILCVQKFPAYILKLLPDIYKYHPLFLPLCGCQSAQAMGLFWVFSMVLASTFHIKGLLTSWNTHKPVLQVVCHLDNLLKAAYVKPHVHIMPACLCSHTWIHQTLLLWREMLNKCNIIFWKNDIPNLPIQIYICALSVWLS